MTTISTGRASVKVAVIQARSGSTRLPRKVLAPILGKPMVLRIVERVTRARHLDRVIIATTSESTDDALATLIEASGLGCYRGSVDDLVERLCGAARYSAADVVVRIWGDCPFADADVIDRALQMQADEQLDYVSNTIVGERTFPAGLDVEVYQRQALEGILAETLDPFFREFPAEYVIKHPQRFRRGVLRCDEDLSAVHMTVDYPQDLQVAEAIYAALYRADQPFPFRDAVAFLQQHPGLAAGASELPRNIEYFQKRSARE